MPHYPKRRKWSIVNVGEENKFFFLKQSNRAHRQAIIIMAGTFEFLNNEQQGIKTRNTSRVEVRTSRGETHH
jgi:hypothetical protein